MNGYIKPTVGRKIKEVLDSYELSSELDRVEFDCPSCGEPARVVANCGVNYGSSGYAHWNFSDNSFSCGECGFDGAIEPVITTIIDNCELGRIIKVK